jgi:integrase
VKIIESLIRRALQEAVAEKKVVRLYDGQGLHLHVRMNGSASWRHKFDFGGNKGQLDTLGTYPECSIKEARNRHFANRQMLDAGKNPLEKKRQEKRAAANTFAEVAEQYLKKRKGSLSLRTIVKTEWQFKLINPSIGGKPIDTIKRTDVLDALHILEDKGHIETAHKTLELIGRVFEYAISNDLTRHNVARGASGALIPRPTNQHFAAVTEPGEIGKLLRAIDGFKGQPATMAALRLAPHVFLRPGELRQGRWAEIDFDAAQWCIPAERMKGKKGKKRDHVVPLSRQAIDILENLHKITGHGEYMFPAIGPKNRSISENTLGAALRTLGYSPDQMVPHGFRHMASTRLRELGYNSDHIEYQLSHVDKNKIRGIYNAAQYLPARTKMMQEWSDHLDALRIGRNILPFKKRAS